MAANFTALRTFPRSYIYGQKHVFFRMELLNSVKINGVLSVDGDWLVVLVGGKGFKLLRSNFLAIFRNEITTILTPSTSEGCEWGRWGWSLFSF